SPTPHLTTGIVSGNVYKLINGCGGKALDVVNDSNVLNDGANVQVYDRIDGATNQEWKLEKLTTDTVPVYKLTSVKSGKVLDVLAVPDTDNGLKAGANVQQFSWLGGANQKWLISQVFGSSSFVYGEAFTL